MSKSSEFEMLAQRCKERTIKKYSAGQIEDIYGP